LELASKKERFAQFVIKFPLSAKGIFVSFVLIQE